MKKIVIAAMLSVLAVPTFAGDFYVGAQSGTVNYNYENISNKSQSGWNAFGGYQFNQNFAAEVAYARLGGFDTASRKYKGTSVGINGVGIFPIGDSFAFIFKLGFANTKIEATPQPGWTLVGPTSFSASGTVVGIAGQFNVTPQFGIRIASDVYPIGDSTSGTTTARLLSVGGVYRF